MWKSKLLNDITDYWITLFYGFPAFAWTPTHNKNHHKFNNREGDFTITYRVSEKNNIFTLLSYPSISSYFQQNPIVVYLKFLWKNKRSKFYISIFQYVALGLFIIIALLIDWKKALLYVIIPQQFALFSVLIFNYIQHVHADEESDYNHSRNFVSPTTNFLLFNNGFHTIHHFRASIHWSETPEAHKKIDHLIAPHLKERGFWPYIIKAYIIAPFNKTFRTKSMRLDRIAKERSVGTSQVS
jgi:fatty acid desaturase